MISAIEIINVLKSWYQCWNNHDLESVLQLFHEETVYIDYKQKKVIGKNNIRRLWKPWFDNHNDFVFIEIETFFDEKNQKALFRWLYREKNKNDDTLSQKGIIEEGVDVLHFKDNKIVCKSTYIKNKWDNGKNGKSSNSEYEKPILKIFNNSNNSGR